MWWWRLPGLAVCATLSSPNHNLSRLKLRKRGSPGLTSWTAQLVECVEENVYKRNRVGAVAVLPSIYLHQCQGGSLPLTLSSRPERSGVEGPAVSLSAEAKVRGRIASRFRFSINANRRSLR
jgi:hypothetical protein